MKQKTTTVYKVTYLYQSWYGIARSSGIFNLSYYIGFKTVPRFGKILAFATKQQAYDFYLEKGFDDEQGTIFFEGKGTNPTRIKVLVNDLITNGAAFWKARKNKKAFEFPNETYLAPKGTVAVDSFTPTKQYTPYEFCQECKKEKTEKKG